MDQNEELERLRRRVAELESERAAADAAAPEAPVPGRPGARWRSIVAATLITLSCVLAPLSVTAVWANNQISNTDRYVQTVAPLAHDPGVQRAIADTVTQEVFAHVDVNALTSDALAAIAAQGLPPRAAAGLQALQVPIVNGIQSFTRSQVGKAVASPQFATVWDRANRAAHASLVRLLSGEQGGAVSAQNGTVTLNLAPIIAQVKQRLIASGYSVASNIPTVNRSFVLVRSDAVTRAQGAYRLLNTLGSWLPVIALALLAIGVYVARDRRRALVRGTLGIVGSMLVLGVAIALARPLYLDSVPTDVLPRDVAGTVFDTLVRFLRNGLRVTAVLALVVAAGAFFTGPSPAAVRTRSTSSRALGSLRGSAESAGLRTGPVGSWTFAHKRLLRIAVVAIGAFTLTFWSQPTVGVVVVTAAAVLVAVALIELVGRPPAPQPLAQPPAQGEGTVPRQRQPGTPSASSRPEPAEPVAGTQTDKETAPHG